MRTIEITTLVTSDDKLTVQVPADLPEGEYRVVIVIDEQPIKKETQSLADFPVRDYGPWPANLSLRREDMYDEWGR